MVQCLCCVNWCGINYIYICDMICAGICGMLCMLCTVWHGMLIRDAVCAESLLCGVVDVMSCDVHFNVVW